MSNNLAAKLAVVIVVLLGGSKVHEGLVELAAVMGGLAN